MPNRHGYVYILTNPCIKYILKEGKREKVISPVKIGFTRSSLEGRVGTLNTALPENFVHHMSVETDDPKALENIIHGFLDRYKIQTKDNEKTEFFSCSIDIACKALKKAIKNMHLVGYHIRKDKLRGRSASKMRTNALKFSKAKNKILRNTWKSKNKFALWIAKKGGGEGSLGNILGILRGTRPCAAKSKWRKLLEREGIKFNSTNFVTNWSSFEKSFIKQK